MGRSRNWPVDFAGRIVWLVLKIDEYALEMQMKQCRVARSGRMTTLAVWQEMPSISMAPRSP